MIYCNKSISKIKENCSTLFSEMAIVTNNQNRSFCRLFRVSGAPWSPLEYTSSRASEAGSSRTSFSWRRWPLLLPLLGRDIDNGQREPIFWLPHFIHIVSCIFESDIESFFPPRYFLTERELFMIWQLETSAYLSWYCRVRQASEFVRLFISSLDPCSRLDSLRASEETIKGHVFENSTYIYIYISFIYNFLLQEIK